MPAVPPIQQSVDPFHCGRCVRGARSPVFSFAANFFTKCWAA